MRPICSFVIVALLLISPAAWARPDLIPEADWKNIEPLVDAAHVTWLPYKGLAIKKDEKPFRVLDLRLFMGDDYQVVAHNIAKTQLESAGAQYTLLSAEFDASAQARMLEDAIATKAYDAVIMQPLDRQAMAVPVEKAAAAGIDVYVWVTPVPTEKSAGFAGYKADALDDNGQIGRELVRLAKAAGATPEKPFQVLEIWGLRSIPLCVERHKGVVMGFGDYRSIQLIESVDTGGQPEPTTKAIQDAFARYPDIKAIYPQFGDASATIEGLRSVDHLAPKGSPKHVAVFLQDIDKAMLQPLRDGIFDGTVSNEPWHQMDVVIKQFLWHTVLKQPLEDAPGKLPKNVLLPMPFLTGETIDTQAAHLWGGTVAFPEMPLGKWSYWPVLNTTAIGLPTPTLADRKRLLGY